MFFPFPITLNNYNQPFSSSDYNRNPPELQYRLSLFSTRLSLPRCQIPAIFRLTEPALFRQPHRSRVPAFSLTHYIQKPGKNTAKRPSVRSRLCRFKQRVVLPPVLKYKVTFFSGDARVSPCAGGSLLHRAAERFFVASLLRMTKTASAPTLRICFWYVIQSASEGSSHLRQKKDSSVAVLSQNGKVRKRKDSSSLRSSE